MADRQKTEEPLTIDFSKPLPPSERNKYYGMEGKDKVIRGLRKRSPEEIKEIHRRLQEAEDEMMKGK